MSKEPETINLAVNSGYNKWSKTYDADKNLLFALETKNVIIFLEPIKNKKILDVGCGTGRYSIILAKGGAKVTGMDFSQNMLKIARKGAEMEKLKIDFRYGNVNKLSFEDNTFDKITCNLVLCHISNVTKILKEMARVVKPNGIIVISDLNPFFCGKMGRTYFFVKNKRYRIRTYIHTFEDFLRLFKSLNLQIEDLKEFKIAKKFRKHMHDKRLYRNFEGKPVSFIFKLQKG